MFTGAQNDWRGCPSKSDTTRWRHGFQRVHVTLMNRPERKKVFSNMTATSTKDADGSVSEYLVINGNRVMLRFAPDSERENSAETMKTVKEILSQEFTGSGKLINPQRN